MAKKENKNVHEVVQKIDGDTWKSAIDKVFLEKQKTVKVDGFRQGKMPRKVLEKTYGEFLFYEDALNTVCDDSFFDFLEKERYY